MRAHPERELSFAVPEDWALPDVASRVSAVLGPLEEPSPDVLTRYLREQCRAVLLGELGLRAEVDVSGVHDTRIAIRRLRSTLRTFAGHLRHDAVAMDDELRWLAGLLSDVRDADVLREHLRLKVEQLPPHQVLGPVPEELDEVIGRERDAAVRRWTSERGGARYAAVLGSVLAWYRRPPVVEAPTQKQGSEILARSSRKVRARLDRALDEESTHSARKAAKRLRYAAELLEPLVPQAGRIRKHARQVQDLLGDHQDLVVEAAFLRRQAAGLRGREGHSGFTYGLLTARAEHEAAGIRASGPALKPA